MTASAIPTYRPSRDDFIVEDPRILVTLVAAAVSLWLPGPFLITTAVLAATSVLAWNWLLPPGG